MNKIQPAMEIPEQVYQDLPKNVPGWLNGKSTKLSIHLCTK
jgi:hypothetical protein